MLFAKLTSKLPNLVFYIIQEHLLRGVTATVSRAYNFYNRLFQSNEGIERIFGAMYGSFTYQ